MKNPLLHYCFSLLAGWCCFFSGLSQTTHKKIYLQLVVADSTITQNDRFSNYNELQSHVDSLSITLQEKGFLTAYYSAPKKVSDSVFTSTLLKNTQTKYIRIKNSAQLPELIKKQLRISKNQKEYSFPIESLKQKLQLLNSQLSDNGSPFNSVQLKNIATKGDSLFADLDISNLKKRTIDSIIVKGYKKFPVGFLTHYIGLKKGRLYREQKIQEQTAQLNNLAFVTSVKSAEVLFNPKSTQLYLYLKKQNANNFDGFLGFSTEEESGNLILDGYLNLNLINNLNFGEELSLSYKSDSEDQQQFKVFAKLPYLFKLPLGLEAGLNIFRQKDVFSNTEQKIGLNYIFTPRLEALVGYKKYESADLNENTNVVGTVNPNFDAAFLHLEARYNHKQNQLLFPVKTSLIFSSEIGSREQAKTNQYRLSLKTSHIIQLNFKNSIYISNHAQFLQSDNYLANELFRFGGIQSIRGFEENSLRGSLVNILNTEYRYQLSETIYAHTIIDFAYLDNQAPRSTANPEIVGSNNLTSIGLGLGVLTKAGLFKLNYANGKDKDNPFKFGNSKVHLSLTAYF